MNHQDIGQISAILHWFKSHLAEAFAEKGIAYPPMQIKVLRLISQRAPCTAQCVAQTLGRDKGQVTRLLQELVADGILLREPNPGDKRSQLLSLSEAGEALFARMCEAEQQVLKLADERLDPEDQSAFSSLCRSLNAQLNGRNTQ